MDVCRRTRIFGTVATEPKHTEGQDVEIAQMDVPGEPVPRTGDPEIDHVLKPLEGLSDQPLTEHIEIFETVYGELQNHLALAEDA